MNNAYFEMNRKSAVIQSCICKIFVMCWMFSYFICQTGNWYICIQMVRLCEA